MARTKTVTGENVEVGQRIEYKTDPKRRGKPIKAFVIGRSARQIVVERTSNHEVVRIKPKDVVGLAEKVKYKKRS